MLVGHVKPVAFAHTPPGAYQNYIYLVLAAAMIALSYLFSTSLQNYRTNVKASGKLKTVKQSQYGRGGNSTRP
jgi:hypothetical protein